MQLSIFYIVFTLCISTSYSTGLLQISNGVSYVWQMVRTRPTKDVALDIPEGSTGYGRGFGQDPCGNPPPPPPPHPPVRIEQLLATQNELMSVLVPNEAHRGVGRPQNLHQQDMNTSYSDFLASHPPWFSGANDLLEEDDSLRITESKIGLLQCTKYQKTLYAAQQLRGSVGA
jgi:hypothetical protein